MEEIFLDAELRQEVGKNKAKALRRKGFIPAVVYSAGKESLPIKLSHREFVRLIHQQHSRLENKVVKLKVKDDKKHKESHCLVKEMHYDPVTDEVLHVDFNEISLTKVIKVNVPVVTKGESIGVKQEGGSLEQILWEIEVECLPGDIPKGVEIDVGPLKIGDSIHIKDITLPAGVKVLNDPTAIILTVSTPMKEEVPAAPVEGEVPQEPEVIKEKKEVPAEGEQEEEGRENKKEK